MLVYWLSLTGTIVFLTSNHLSLVIIANRKVAVKKPLVNTTKESPIIKKEMPSIKAENSYIKVETSSIKTESTDTVPVVKKYTSIKKNKTTGINFIITLIIIQ